MLQIDHHNSPFHLHPSPHMAQMLSPGENLECECLSIFQQRNAVRWTTVTMLDIPFPRLIYFVTSCRCLLTFVCKIQGTKEVDLLQVLTWRIWKSIHESSAWEMYKPLLRKPFHPWPMQLSEENRLSLGTFQEFHQILSLCVAANSGHTLAHNPILISVNIILGWVEIWFLR